MSSRIQMTRAQIAEFLHSPEAIKTFERLLAVANSIRDGAVVEVNGVESVLPVGGGITVVGSDATYRWIDFPGVVRFRWPLAGGTVTAINL